MVLSRGEAIALTAPAQNRTVRGVKRGTTTELRLAFLRGCGGAGLHIRKQLPFTALLLSASTKRHRSEVSSAPFSLSRSCSTATKPRCLPKLRMSLAAWVESLVAMLCHCAPW